MTCSSCGGSGQIIEYHYWTNGDWGAGVSYHTCVSCQGTGTVPDPDPAGTPTGCAGAALLLLGLGAGLWDVVSKWLAG
jgi:hypothetical protein